jgi:hypothetical protein
VKTTSYPAIPEQTTIGKYRLIGLEDGSKIWIGRRDEGFEGEGGVFKVADLEKVIAEFYREHF